MAKHQNWLESFRAGMKKLDVATYEEPEEPFTLANEIAFASTRLQDAFESQSSIRGHVFEALIRSHLRAWSTELASIEEDLIKSPIEFVMLAGLMVAGAARFRRVLVRERGHLRLGDPSFEDYIIIEPQAAIGQYRVDFIVEGVDPFNAGWLTSETGVRVEDFKARLVVECDGHDFHERTKEQASKDKKRDRELQKAGFRVFRYSGSDLWRDPIAAADEVVSEIRSKLTEQSERAWAEAKKSKGDK